MAFFETLFRVYDSRNNYAESITGKYLGVSGHLLHYDDVANILEQIFKVPAIECDSIVRLQVDRAQGGRGTYVSAREFEEYIEDVMAIDYRLIDCVLSFGRLLDSCPRYYTPERRRQCPRRVPLSRVVQWLRPPDAERLTANVASENVELCDFIQWFHGD